MRAICERIYQEHERCCERILKFKSNVRETWRVILVSEADMFFTESLRILAERLSQSEIGLPLRLICYNSPPEEVGVLLTEIKSCIYKQKEVYMKRKM